MTSIPKSQYMDIVKKPLNVHCLTPHYPPGQLYVAASRVGSPDSILFAVKKPVEPGMPYLTPNVVYREVLLDPSETDAAPSHPPSAAPSQPPSAAPLLSQPLASAAPVQSQPPVSAAPIVVAEDVPRDTDYEGIYDGIPGDDQHDRDDLEDLSPSTVGHRRPRVQCDSRLKGRTYESTGCFVEGRELARPRDYSPVRLAPRVGWDEPLSEYEKQREVRMQEIREGLARIDAEWREAHPPSQ